MSLNPKQLRFCEEYVIDSNGTAAAKRAGYSEKTAYSQAERMLRKVEIQREVQRLKTIVSAKLQITAEWVLERLVENQQRASQAVAVKDRDGNPTGEWTYQGSVVNKALELIGRHRGMFVDRVEIGASATLVITEEIIDADSGHGSAKSAGSEESPTPSSPV